MVDNLKLGPVISEEGETTILRHERAQGEKIWKFALETEGAEGVFELGSFQRNGDRHDICISTMAGCPLKCTMCAIPYSAKPFQRRLTQGEMENQVRLAIKKRKEAGAGDSMEHTIGFMGNGEPFANFDEVFGAANALIEAAMRNEFLLRSITVSTTGVRSDLISKLVDLPYGKSGIGKLQYSLMSVNEDRRKKLIPNGGSLEECLPELDRYAAATGVAIKYNIPLIEGMNDSIEEAEEFARFIAEAPHLRRAKISTFNPFPGISLKPSSAEQTNAFLQTLKRAGIEVKQFFGDLDDEVFASCGQLRARMESLLSPHE